jgi:hypothetical protein
MNSDELLIFGAFGGMALFMIAVTVGVWMLARRSKLRTGLQATQDAAARGWKLQTTDEGGAEVQRWSGSTDGVAWTAEHRVTRERGGSRPYARYQTRWRADARGGPSSPVLITPERSSLKRLDSVADAVPAGFLRSLVESATDKVIDRYFGAEVGAVVDLPALASLDGHGLPGATVMAAQPSEALLLMRYRIAPALAAEAASPASIFADAEPPAVMLLPASVHLASRASASSGDIERLARAGATLVNALK